MLERQASAGTRSECRNAKRAPEREANAGSRMLELDRRAALGDSPGSAAIRRMQVKRFPPTGGPRLRCGAPANGFVTVLETYP